jgi:tetratricopeptide (TPR) repeat protein
MSQLRQHDEIEILRQGALARVRANELDEAIFLFDQALAMLDTSDADGEELHELLTINKADTLISLELNGPEVNELPKIIMRRRNLRHVYLAAYALQFKHRQENDFKRATFYGQLALRTADDAAEPAWKRIVLIDLGNIYEMDSRIPEAIECFESALRITEESADNRDRDLSFGYALENLGYCKLLEHDYTDGIALIHRALEVLSDPHGVAEAYVDLCYGYLELEQLDRARSYGEHALAMATEIRQIRNLHYLLGEVAHKSGDTDAAGFHFEKLAEFYPDFRHLKDVLFAIDLRGMVNFKL